MFSFDLFSDSKYFLNVSYGLLSPLTYNLIITSLNFRSVFLKSSTLLLTMSDLII